MKQDMMLFRLANDTGAITVPRATVPKAGARVVKKVAKTNVMNPSSQFALAAQEGKSGRRLADLLSSRTREFPLRVQSNKAGGGVKHTPPPRCPPPPLAFRVAIAANGQQVTETAPSRIASLENASLLCMYLRQLLPPGWIESPRHRSPGLRRTWPNQPA
jgi:hypothetical protein